MNKSILTVLAAATAVVAAGTSFAPPLRKPVASVSASACRWVRSLPTRLPKTATAASAPTSAASTTPTGLPAQSAKPAPRRAPVFALPAAQTRSVPLNWLVQKPAPTHAKAESRSELAKLNERRSLG